MAKKREDEATRLVIELLKRELEVAKRAVSNRKYEIWKLSAAQGPGKAQIGKLADLIRTVEGKPLRESKRPGLRRPEGPPSHVVRMVRKLSPEMRVLLFSRFCVGCGTENPACKCQHDE